MIWVVYAICFIVGMAALVITFIHLKNLPTYCNGDCEQGRNCDCMDNMK